MYEYVSGVFVCFCFSRFGAINFDQCVNIVRFALIWSYVWKNIGSC
jgi:hypothetical protein